jgi:multicomponent Na+:H+ antiporter subunit D
MLATALTAAALLRAGARVFLGWGPRWRPATDPRESPTEESELVGARGRVPAVMSVSAAVLIVGGLVVGAVPGVVARAQESAHAFTDRAAYAAAVLGRPVPRAAPIDYVHASALEVVLGVLTALGAVGLTAVMLGRLRLPYEIPRVVRRAAEAGLWRLRRQHSGQLGDYVAWATVGFALLTGLLTVAT